MQTDLRLRTRDHRVQTDHKINIHNAKLELGGEKKETQSALFDQLVQSRSWGR